ncbi:Putative charged multivesicular body protein [Podospora comata]|uniref:Charged multivesicular body protein n=1 Tax=Podospora comata TaxID=48703 RepID=A0ABY6SF86_PODCO|nr:Putative charged multivesicular body protein [Podospora comata]
MSTILFVGILKTEQREYCLIPRLPNNRQSGLALPAILSWQSPISESLAYVTTASPQTPPHKPLQASLPCPSSSSANHRLSHSLQTQPPNHYRDHHHCDHRHRNPFFRTTTSPLNSKPFPGPKTAKMNRLFGTPAPKAPKPTLNTAITSLDTRISSIDVKLSALNTELTTYQTKLSKMRDGPGKTALKQKALKVLQRRKQYEAQRDQLQSQVWNMEQAQTMQDNLKNTMVTIDALKQTNKALKKEYGKVDIDKIERLQDEMADLLDVGNEIQESLARSYDIPEDVDEAELDAELEALGQEVELEREMMGGDMNSLPSFMQDEVPEFIDEPPVAGQAGKVKEAAG